MIWMWADMGSNWNMLYMKSQYWHLKIEFYNWIKLQKYLMNLFRIQFMITMAFALWTFPFRKMQIFIAASVVCEESYFFMFNLNQFIAQFVALIVNFTSNWKYWLNHRRTVLGYLYICRRVNWVICIMCFLRPSGYWMLFNVIEISLLFHNFSVAFETTFHMYYCCTIKMQ